MPLESESLTLEMPLRKLPLNKRVSLKIATTAILAAVGVVLSYILPTSYFTINGAKIDPFAHMINAISGVLLGPWYAMLTALIIAIIRFSTGIGTIYAFPGGISGAFVVGLMRELILRINPKKVNFAALFEPIGTIFIGGTIASYMSYNFTATFKLIPTQYYILWGTFAIACIPGTILGWIGLKALENYGLTTDYFDEGKEAIKQKRTEFEQQKIRQRIKILIWIAIWSIILIALLLIAHYSQT
jgi:energy coupling factor transporter S component ThiW